MVILLPSAIALLVWYLPIAAAALFIACVVFVAVAVGRTKGFGSGVKLFIKEMLFGW